MKFTKMHGLGNDYIYVDCTKGCIKNPSNVSRLVSDRHLGIGSDGLVLILESEVADFKMRMFNSDGSEAEMCGNAIRCVGKYLYDNEMTNKKEIKIETLAGIKNIELTVKDNKVSLVKVDMGEPILSSKSIPVAVEEDKVIDYKVSINKSIYNITCVSMGNPHTIIFMDNVMNDDILKIGPIIETNNLFPKRTNVEFVQIIDKKTIKMRVWERGAGETLACGTGACAVLVASVLNGFSERTATVKLLGGDLLIDWNKENNHVFMTGPATLVYKGEYYGDN